MSSDDTTPAPDLKDVSDTASSETPSAATMPHQPSQSGIVEQGQSGIVEQGQSGNVEQGTAASSAAHAPRSERPERSESESQPRNRNEHQRNDGGRGEQSRGERGGERGDRGDRHGGRGGRGDDRRNDSNRGGEGREGRGESQQRPNRPYILEQLGPASREIDQKLRAQLTGTVVLHLTPSNDKFLFDWRPDGEGARLITPGGEVAAPDCLITLSEESFSRIRSGELNPQIGMLTEKIRITGNSGLAVYFFNILSSRPHHGNSDHGDRERGDRD